MNKLIMCSFALAVLAGCQTPATITGASYPAISPENVKMSFSNEPTCANPQEIGAMLGVGANKHAQERALNEIRQRAASLGANYVLLDANVFNAFGDMTIDAILYRCVQ